MSILSTIALFVSNLN